ncbi:MAG: nucleotide pyrophosphatase [Acidobacteria bacterium]|nr:MAG: nucleotide pyrophosphatase [Acidobacteriota bacterium]
MRRRHTFVSVLCLVGLQLLWPSQAHAYVGPGAGFAFISSFFTLLAAFFLGLFYLISSPIRALVRAFYAGRAPTGEVRRVVIVGLDGMDPQLAEKFMAEGKLPNFRRLKDRGGFAPLATSFPAISPVAWSSFMTGVDASHHNIFDFITRDPGTYLPMLSSAQVMGPRRTFSLGSWVLPAGKARIIGYRRSRTFWSVLGEKGIFSSVIRVPITFPVEKFNGVLLAGMCVPDLKGTQGSFAFYTTNPDDKREASAGTKYLVENHAGLIKAEIYGPDNPLRSGSQPLRAPLTIRINERKGAGKVVIEVSGRRVEVVPETYSPWVQVVFPAGLGFRVRGICRFYVKSLNPHFELYVTPLQIDPAKPALPVSHPLVYSVYLSKLLGSFATLGLAEDTSALNEGFLDDKGFLDQAYLYHDERERQFFSALRRTTRGLCACVFDVTDRIQHMFFTSPNHQGVIEDLYVRMDAMIGRTLQELGEDDALFVMSDHGFSAFRRGVNLNTWLSQNGYLVLKDEKTTGREWFGDVDWDRTRAYSLGLAGIFINRKGREARGTVDQDGELKALKAELAGRLGGLRDPRTAETAITRVLDTEGSFPGPYAAEGPDLLVCYNRGFRSSWECATGQVTSEVFEDNQKPWSGDHCMDPEMVPGVLFANRPLKEGKPDIKDLAPTVLRLFGVAVPSYMKGKRLV